MVQRWPVCKHRSTCTVHQRDAHKSPTPMGGYGHILEQAFSPQTKTETQSTCFRCLELLPENPSSLKVITDQLEKNLLRPHPNSFRPQVRLHGMLKDKLLKASSGRFRELGERPSQDLLPEDGRWFEYCKPRYNASRRGCPVSSILVDLNTEAQVPRHVWPRSRPFLYELLVTPEKRG